MSRVLPPASSARAPHASAPENPARAARHAARQSASLACLKPSRRVGFASLAPRRDARRSGTLAASEDPDAEVEAMVDVDAIRAMIDSDPAVRAQEARIASEARNAASLQVDKQMAEASDAIRSELSRRGSAASDELAKTQEAALAELEVRSDAVLRAEAKMREIAAEREALEAEAKETSVKKKWGASVGDDVDEDAERVESAKAAACSAIAGTLLSAPLLLSQSPGGLVSLESLGGVFASTALFGVVFPTRDARRSRKRSAQDGRLGRVRLDARPRRGGRLPARQRRERVRGMGGGGSARRRVDVDVRVRVRRARVRVQKRNPQALPDAREEA